MSTPTKYQPSPSLKKQIDQSTLTVIERLHRNSSSTPRRNLTPSSNKESLGKSEENNYSLSEIQNIYSPRSLRSPRNRDSPLSTPRSSPYRLSQSPTYPSYKLDEINV